MLLREWGGMTPPQLTIDTGSRPKQNNTRQNLHNNELWALHLTPMVG